MTDMTSNRPRERLPVPFVRLNLTQFLGALNDNLFKLFMVLFLLNAQGSTRAAEVTALGSAVFVLPFLLLTPLGGKLADRVSKGAVIRSMKLAEIAVMGLGAWALASRWEPALYATLALMASQSALFGPSKYGVIPELVPGEDLSRANSQVEAATYVAIIAGTAAAPWLFPVIRQQPLWAGVLCVAVAVAGWWASWGVGATLAVNQGENGQGWLRGTRDSLRRVRSDRDLLLAVLGSALFMVLGAFAQLNLIPYGMEVLGYSEAKAAGLFLTAALGIGAGSLLAGRLSQRNVELGIVPLGAGLMALGCTGLGILPPALWSAYGATAVFGVGGGLFIVPVHATIQFVAPARHRGEIIAASGWLGWVGVLVASAALYAMERALGWTPRQQFAALAVVAAGVTPLTLIALPDFTLRFAARILVHTFYRLRVAGREHVPVRGGALVVPNHVSWVDAPLLLATTQRRIRFVMLRSIYEWRGLRWLFRQMGVIPISPEDPPREIVAALQEARAALKDGYLVCIFAEGAITRDGRLQPFRSGFERIVRGTDFPVIPAHLGGMWGSIFSHAWGKGIFRRPKRIPYPATVSFASPLPSTATTAQVRAEVEALESRTFRGDNADGNTLPQRLVHGCRKHWDRRALADTTGKQLSFGKVLTGAVALAAPLVAGTKPGANVGVLVPPSVGGALVNLSLTLAGRIPVNLNFTASGHAFRHALATARIERVIASRALVERLGGAQDLPGVVWLEDLAGALPRRRRIAAYLKARWLPLRFLLGNSRGASPQDPAAILFSSGSTGLPKGVVLSHRNLLANVDAVAQSLEVRGDDNLCAALPLFHSFGLTATLWLPVLKGFSATYHTNPLDGAGIAAAVRNGRSTILLATPTFLLSYLRRASPEDFRSLRLVMTGAEPLKKTLADRFQQRFGVRPLEGYGATELSPVATFNLPPLAVGGRTVERAREGSVGCPIPGVRVRTVHPGVGEVLPAGEEGVLQFAGPNVFCGYLGREDDGLVDGEWYDTGDLGRVDEDGFVWITGRLARFSKIAGEMVPHGAVEEVLQAALADPEEPGVAVTGVPDEKRGERLVVFYVEGRATVARLLEALRRSALPNLWKPAQDAFRPIQCLPLLGSGKLDLQALRQRAAAIG